jgi:DNA primase
MIPAKDLHEEARAFHRCLPQRLWDYRNARGIPDAVIHRHLLGWNGLRITIPITNREGQAVAFKLAKDPADASDSPKMIAALGSRAELYGWEHIAAKPEQIIICEGEFDRLVLESQGFVAVTSTCTAGTFRPEWGAYFEPIPSIYVCFDNDVADREGAKRVAQVIPLARVVHLPGEVGEGGDVTDFFVRLTRP